MGELEVKGAGCWFGWRILGLGLVVLVGGLSLLMEKWVVGLGWGWMFAECLRGVAGGGLSWGVRGCLGAGVLMLFLFE